MRPLERLSLRARLALALVGVAALAVGLATLLSNIGLEPRVSAAAHSRLERSAQHVAQMAAAVYLEQGGWTRQSAQTVRHLAALNGLRAVILTARGTPLPGTGPAPAPDGGARATALIRGGGRTLGRVVVAPLGGELLSPEERHLQHSLDRWHLVAGAVSVAGALLLAFLLAETLTRPLRRIRVAAQRIERGDLDARVAEGGDPELRAVGRAINRLAETLQHEEELRKESVADLAHELRTPVSGILSRIEAAQDGVLEDEAANLAAMHAEAVRLSRLLDDLAKLAEAERPGLLVEKRPVDLAEVAEREAATFAPLFADRGIAFHVDLAPAPVLGDPHRLGQIASNLLSNALRYTEPGGEVRLRTGGENGSALLEVTDTGMGIAPDDLKHIFKRFWRGEKSRSRATGGAGIGLAIVRELVRAHDGRIDVESSPGRGSCFRVLLPARPAGVRGAGARLSSHLGMSPRR